MHLTPYELDKLNVVSVGLLAQRRLARGLKLSYPEAVGLISLVILEHIRDGQHGVSDLMEMGGTILGRREVMEGVGALLESLHIEGTFPDGTKLVAISQPIRHQKGNLALALYGSFLPVPDAHLFESASDASTHSSYQFADNPIILNEGRKACTLKVTNTDVRPIQIGSHFHFVEANPRLVFDREQAYGMRLDIPAGNALRFEPGQARTVQLVEISGDKIIKGGNGFATGALNASSLAIKEKLHALSPSEKTPAE